jgi:hypothetical protein
MDVELQIGVVRLVCSWESNCLVFFWHRSSITQYFNIETADVELGALAPSWHNEVRSIHGG